MANQGLLPEFTSISGAWVLLDPSRLAYFAGSGALDHGSSSFPSPMGVHGNSRTVARIQLKGGGSRYSTYFAVLLEADHDNLERPRSSLLLYHAVRLRGLQQLKNGCVVHENGATYGDGVAEGVYLGRQGQMVHRDLRGVSTGPR